MEKRDIAWSKFGTDLRQYRVGKGMGLREAARALHVTHSTWARAEAGKPIRPAEYLWLVDWIGVDARMYLTPIYTRP